MKRTVIIFLCLLLFPSYSIAQSAKDAYRAMKKVEAQYQAGVIYKQYLQAIGEAKFELNLFSESPEAEKTPELLKCFQVALSCFEDAAEAWKSKTDWSMGRPHFVEIIDPNREEYWINKYPDGNEEARKNKIGYLMRIKPEDPKSTHIAIDFLIRHIWYKASLELRKASIHLQKK